MGHVVSGIGNIDVGAMLQKNNKKFSTVFTRVRHNLTF